MIDEFDELDGQLARANPVNVDRVPDACSPAARELYARLERQLAAEGRRPFRGLPPSRAAALALMVLLLVVASAVAAVAAGPWWQTGRPPVNPDVVDRQLIPNQGGFPPAADRARARTVASSDGAALVAAPVGGTGYCLIPSLPGSPDIGFSCTYEVEHPASGASDEFRSYARPAADGEPRWIVYGRVTDPRARVLDLSDAAGTPLAIDLGAGGFFLADVPRERWHALAGTAGAGRILDDAGDTLRTGCVSWGPSPYDDGAGESRWGFWTEGGGPCRARPTPATPTPLYDRAEKLVEIILDADHGLWAAGTTIALWRAPTPEGGECVYVGLATTPGGRAAGLAGLPGPGACTLDRSPQTVPERPLSAQFSWTRQGPDDYGVVVNGQVQAAGRVARVVLRTPAGEEEIAYGNGFYLAQLPATRAAGQLPPGGPHTVVAYDAAGREVARLALRPAHPR